VTKRKQLDLLVVDRGLATNRTQARGLIMAGEVMVNGQTRTKPGMMAPADATVAVRKPPRYVSRGGLKLEAAIDRLAVNVQGRVCADIGASTGGFTDCLLQHGAARVYAVDVGYGQLAWTLRQDARVVVIERTNVRHLTSLPEPVDLVTVDVSFISLGLVLPVVRSYLRPEGEVVALIKPQFEAGRDQVGKGGVVRDPAVHRAVLRELGHWAEAAGWAVIGLVLSPLRGPAGNAEFFIHLRPDGQAATDLDRWIETCLRETARPE